jgi:acetyltransferase-like isoleucine patch superfamily enzyme
MAICLEHDWFPKPLPENVEIGDRSWLYSSFAFAHYKSRKPCGVKVGQDTGLYNGTFFDLGPEGEVVIGDYCTLVGVIISTNSRIEIGDYGLFAHEVVLADSCIALPGGDCRKRAESIRIGNTVWVGAHATILSGASIGEGAIIGAAAVVDFHVPDYAIVAGNPARVIGWANE